MGDSLAHYFLRISLKFPNFLSYFAKRQTDNLETNTVQQPGSRGADLNLEKGIRLLQSIPARFPSEVSRSTVSDPFSKAMI